MAYQDFNASRREAEQETVAFTVLDERFECEPVGRIGPLFDLAHAGLTIRSCCVFLFAVTAAGDRERIEETLREVDVDTLTDIVQWLVKVYTGRPTLPSSGSPDGRPNTGGTSTLVSAAPGRAA